MANGYANRFLFAKVRRSKKLPHGGNLDEAEVIRLGGRTRAAIESARKIGRVTMTTEAAEAWSAAYGSLGDNTAGMAAEITARAAPQVIRIALTYAVLDDSSVIDLPHLRAALAVWDYCEQSACQIFGDALGDPIADAILVALQQTGGVGLSRTDIRDLFGRNCSGDRLDVALALLKTRGRARTEMRTTGGRPSETWVLTNGRG
jgi:hypothetical protein